MTVQSRMLSSSFLANSMQSPFSNVSFNHNHHSGVFIRSSLADTGNEHPSTILVKDRTTEPCYDWLTDLSPMSEEQLKAFLEKVEADTSLQEKLKAASDADGVVAIAKEAGFMISAEDLTKAQSEVSEKELEGAAGGGACTLAGGDWGTKCG